MNREFERINFTNEKKIVQFFFQKSQQLSIGYNAAIDSYIDAVVD
jgi:hypothetical protein